MESERLKDTPDQKDEWWANAVTWYHKNIASPESDEHRENMLSGYPTRKLLLYIIEPQAMTLRVQTGTGFLFNIFLHCLIFMLGFPEPH
jgi:hypothetical protein